MKKRLTHLSRTQIRKLMPGQSISARGVSAEKLSNGDVRFSVNLMVDRRRVHKAIGLESDGFTLSDAEDFAADTRSKTRRGNLDLPKGRKAPKSIPTFQQAARDYKALMKDTGGKNRAVKKAHLQKHLVPFFGPTRLDHINEVQIQKYKRDRVNAELAPATVNRTLATLSHLLHCAVEEGWVSRLPLIVEKFKFKEDNARIIVLSDDELARLKKAAIDTSDPGLWLFVEIAAATGMRHAEVLRVRWPDCDLVNRRIFVPQAKAGARMQPIPETLASTLKDEWLQRTETEREGYIFPKRYARSTKPHIESFEHQFRRAVEAARLNSKLVTPHTLRHTACTRLVQSGIDLMTVKAITGHKDLRMVQRYSHVSGPHIDAAINKALG
jgi:integrase